eukprot:5446389-Amphidinium_carterae.1
MNSALYMDDVVVVPHLLHPVEEADSESLSDLKTRMGSTPTHLYRLKSDLVKSLIGKRKFVYLNRVFAGAAEAHRSPN